MLNLYLRIGNLLLKLLIHLGNGRNELEFGAILMFN